MCTDYQTVIHESTLFGVLLSSNQNGKWDMDKKDPPIVSSRRKRLQSWIDIHYKGVQAAFIEKTGINQGELSALLKTKSFGEKKARKIEVDCGMPNMWLDDIYAIENQPTTKAVDDGHDNFDIGPSIRGKVPLISSVQAGLWCEAVDNYHVGDHEELLDCPKSCGKTAYALRVRGDSMTNPIPGGKTYPEGTIIFVDPSQAITSGCRVIAKLPYSNEATFKEYREEDGKRWLKPLNPTYDKIEVTAEIRLCGVVIGKWEDD